MYLMPEEGQLEEETIVVSCQLSSMEQRMYRQHTRISRHVFAIDEIAFDIEEVPSFIQLAVTAADGGFMASDCRQSGQDVAQFVCLGRTGSDAGSGKSLDR
jgi:hypothetical protein